MPIQSQNLSNFMNQQRQQLARVKTNIRFLSEINIILSIFTLLGAFAVIIHHAVKLPKAEGREKDFAVGLLTYASVSFIVSSLDLGLSFLLLIAIKPYENINLEQLLLWFRATFTILIVFILQSLAFFVLLGNILIIVGLLCSLLYKPLALWFINDYVGIFTGSKLKYEKPQEIIQVVSRTSFRRPRPIFEFDQIGDSSQNHGHGHIARGQNLEIVSSDEEVDSFIRKQKYIKIH